MILHPLMFAAVAFAVIYGAGYCWHDRGNWVRSVTKTSALALLAVAGAMMGAPVWVVVGLLFGALGDFFLSRSGRPTFLAGMAAFAIGHLAYAIYFVGLWGTLPFFFGPMVVALIVLTATTEIWLAPRTGALLWPVRGYGVVITAMGVAALGQEVRLILWGAGLFILSDLLLALALFVVPKARWRWILAVSLWAAYWTAQFLILQGALMAISQG